MNNYKNVQASIPSISIKIEKIYLDNSVPTQHNEFKTRKIVSLEFN